MFSTEFSSVINEHGSDLLAYAIRLTGGDRHLAEDIVQETWLRAWKHHDRLTEELGSIRGWLRRIAHNISVDQHRSRRARPKEVTLSTPGMNNATVTGDLTDQVDNRIDLSCALQTLSMAHRSTVVEVYFADHTTTSAATALGIPVGTVKSRIHNALNNLRTALNSPHAA